MRLNKRGAITDLFLAIIIVFSIATISGLMIFVADETKTQLDEVALNLNEDHMNASKIVDETFGVVPITYKLLYWISWVLMIGVFLSLLVGAYLARTRPVFLVANFFVVIIAVVLSAKISNVYMEIIVTPEITAGFTNLVGANLIMSKLPVWVAIMGILGMIIMFISYARGRDES